MDRVYKSPMTITDIVHGIIVLDEMTEELIQTPEISGSISSTSSG